MKLIAIVDGSKNYEVDIPSCIDEYSSGGNSGIISTGVKPSPAQNPDPSLPPIEQIPEFPWIGLPVICITLIVFLFRRK